MSQFIVPIDETKACQLGWDPMLQTYYGRVYKLDENGKAVDVEMVDGEERDGNLLWVGTSFKAIPTVECLETALREHLTIPRNIVIRLEIPQENESRVDTSARQLTGRLRGRSMWRM